MNAPSAKEILEGRGPFVVFCLGCGAALTGSLSALVPCAVLKAEDERSLLPSGTIATAERVLKDIGPWSGLDAGDAIIGRADINAVEGGRRNGCCGPDGCDGPNLFCRCGRPVATER